jgi:serine/threonine-protein kinase
MYCLSGFIVICVALAGYFSYSTPNVEVPAVTGLTVVEAQKVLEDAGFKIKLKEAYDASVTPGTVMKQDPAPKTMKKSGATVTITICRGLEILTVPNVTGQTLDQAKQNLEAAGYKVGNVTKTWDSSKGKDVVLKQSPKADSKLPKGTAIDLVLNEKEEEKPKKAQMPNIVGQSLESGQDKLSALGLNIGELKTVDSDKPANIIVAMSPEAGAAVTSDSKIALTISSGKKPAAPATNTQYVEFVVPGTGDHAVQIFVKDSQKQWVAADGKYKGGTRVRQKLTLSGPAKVQFFVDQKLLEEKSL